MTNEHSDSAPLPREIVDAFAGLASSDVVPRSAPADREQLAALKSIPPGSPITFRDWEVTEHGLREIEIEALYAGHYPGN